MVKSLASDSCETPPSVVCVAVAVWRPDANRVVGVKEKSPVPFAVVVPIGSPSTAISTSAPGCAVPVKVGVVSVVSESSAGVLSAGGGGRQSMPPGGAMAVARSGRRSIWAVARIVLPGWTVMSAVTTATSAVAVWPLGASVTVGWLTVNSTCPVGC